MVKVPVLRSGKVAAPQGAPNFSLGTAFTAKPGVVDVNPPVSPWIDKSVAAQRAEKAGLAALRADVTLDLEPPVTHRNSRIASSGAERYNGSGWAKALTNSLRLADSALVAAAVTSGFLLNTDGLAVAAGGAGHER